MRPDLPAGTVTFLFTDIEGSTRLLNELGTAGYAEALAEHRRILREAFATHGGVEVDTEGDAFFVAFPTAPGAIAAARQATDALRPGPIRVRVGLHTGTPHVTAEGYVGPDVHRAARIAAAGHGGQVLVSATTAALLGGDELRDLGEHRLKDLSAPERIYQLGADEFPPLKTLRQTNLPIPATPFVGREAEVAELKRLLSGDGTRLVTLTGPGGTGKTRLALQAAADVAERFAQGVWWVPLAPLRDAGLVLETAARAIGAKDDVRQYIGDKHLLLVLDNFEQVVEAAGDIAGLLGSCSNLAVVVTSREPLHVGAEREYPVAPLAPSDGVDLFLARARAIRPDFEAEPAVGEICRRLDELPLAIELAAARVRALSPAQILERLEQRLPLLTGGARDLPERQRTLRATIEWSHDLLTDDEQAAFRRLAVFRGGATPEAAEAVARTDLDTLQSLIDKSLLRQREGRFWMLETIREYATERLDASGELAATRDAHLDHFLEIAERAYEERVAGESKWFPLIMAELDNIRAALDWAAGARAEAEAQLAGAVSWYWDWTGHELEAQRRLVAALSRYPRRDRIRARGLTYLGWSSQSEMAQAMAWISEALDLWRELGDVEGEALAVEALGYLHVSLAEHEPATQAFERSIALRRQADAPELDQAEAMLGLCRVFASEHDVARLEPLANRLLELGMRHEHGSTLTMARHYLADCPLIAGDYVEAERRYRAALASARRSGQAAQCPTELLGVAMALAGQGDHARAVRLAAAAYARREAFGYTGPSSIKWWREMQERHIGGARARLAPDELEEAERAGRAAPFEDVLDEVLGAETRPQGATA